MRRRPPGPAAPRPGGRGRGPSLTFDKGSPATAAPVGARPRRLGAAADPPASGLVPVGSLGANNALSCFRWFSTADSTRGNGAAAPIMSMVDKAVADHASDARRVFVTGLPASGAMTSNLLADYPDVFAGGAIMSGLPAQGTADSTVCPVNGADLGHGTAVHPGTGTDQCGSTAAYFLDTICSS